MLLLDMRRAAPAILVVIGALAASTSAAFAHNTPYSWTVAKAQLTLQDEATIAVPEAQRAPLDAEIETLLGQFRRLKLVAHEDPSQWLLEATYGNYETRFSKAQATLNAGLSIDTVKCRGVGKAVKRNRYKHFRCDATSYVLEIPTVELKPGADGALPEVLEGPVRRIGPLEASFTVHVTGKSRMLSQRVG
jgi:hypothetical protein